MAIPPGKLRDWLDARLGQDGLDAVLFLVDHAVHWSRQGHPIARTRLGNQIGYVCRDCYWVNYRWTRTPGGGQPILEGHAETEELAMEALEREWYSHLSVPYPRPETQPEAHPARLTDLLSEGT